MGRHRYEPADPELREPAIWKLVKAGCDREKLEKKIWLSRQIDLTAPTVEGIFGITRERTIPLAASLESNAGEVERVLTSPRGSMAITASGRALTHPELYEEVKDLPRRLRMFAVFLRHAEEAVRRAYPDVRVLPAIAEYELVEYVKGRTGNPHYKELAAVLGCDLDDLKARCHSYRKGRVGVLVKALAAMVDGPE